MDILCYGFFNRQNLGDDVFTWVFNRLFSHNYQVRFINPEDNVWPTENTAAVLVGGGDLINDYFMSQLTPLFSREKFKCPIYAVGVGIPYPDLIEQGYLDGFDYIIHRTWDVHSRLLARYGPGRVHLAPDLAWLLPSSSIETKPPSKLFSNLLCGSEPAAAVKATKKHKVIVCLARPMFVPNHSEHYEKIVESLAEFLSELAETHKLDFVPFGRHGHVHDDRLMNNDVYTKMLRINPHATIGAVRLFDNFVSAEGADIVTFFRHYDFSVCSRFHAHIFSLMAGVPMMSVSCTHKVTSLMAEAGLSHYMYALPVDPAGLYPVDCRTEILRETWHRLIDHEKAIRKHLAMFGTRSRKKAAKTSLILHNLLHFRPRQRVQAVDQVARQVQKFLDKNNNDDDVTEVVNRAARMACYLLTGDPEAKYLWGLRQNMVEMAGFNLLEACKWIYNDHRAISTEFPDWKKYAPPTSHLDDHLPAVNFEYTRHDLGPKVHRSGWTFVMQNLILSHTRKPTADDEQPIIFDGYLDETFGWRAQLLEDAGIIPYTAPKVQAWIGVLHHTPDERFPNNLIRLFQQPAWRESLPTCRGLIVLSEYLAEWVRGQLNNNRHHIPVHTIKHPTEFPVKLWKMSRCNNSLVQVGGWMRHIYSVFALEAPPDVRKFALKGKHHSYLSDDEFSEFYNKAALFLKTDKIHINDSSLISSISSSSSSISSSIGHCEYIRGAWECVLKELREKHASVTLLEFHDDDSYDELLASSVVFLDLGDASAVNTIIECIVRNTPLLVNPLPAVVEYLGEEYPLYYQSLNEASELLANHKQIKKAHKYLKRLDKRDLHISHFLEKVNNGLITAHLSPPPHYNAPKKKRGGSRAPLLI
jgi:polysaccharide pyruvyl transferase WcaK-like protein